METAIGDPLRNIPGEPAAWFAPTYKMLGDVWRLMVHDLTPLIVSANKTERRIELTTGGVIEMWSLEDPNAGRGRKYARDIFDEAAMVADLIDIWTAAIRPTLTDLAGDAWFLSTPKGLNDFWQLHQYGMERVPWWASWTMPTSTNPFIKPEEIEAARSVLPPDVFDQEFGAKFLKDGAIFRGIRESATATWQIEAQPRHRYVVGVDWGKHEDYTVYSVIDCTLGELCYIERMNQISYPVQVSRLQTVVDRFKPAEVIVESNNVGDAIADFIWGFDIPLRQFDTTNSSKQTIIEGLQVAMERGRLHILNDPVLIAELQAFGVERLPSGRLRYSAPSGYHDDCVMSLALAWSAARMDTEDKPHEVAVPLVTRIARIQQERHNGYSGY